MSDAERIRNLLNFSGYPFQHYCADRISRLEKFQLTTEHPFTYPASNAALLGAHGSIDILAACPTNEGDTLVWFVVECKKANDKIKNWILLPNRHQSPKWPTFTITLEEPDGDQTVMVTRNAVFPDLGYESGSDFEFCINGIEANTALKATNANQSEKIYNPLRQVVHGTRAFEVSAPKLVEGIKYTRSGKSYLNIFLPVIVTTANIYTVDVPVSKVSQGEIPADALQLSSPKKWATYEFPLPDYLGYSFKRGKGKTTVAKRTVFIVNEKAIDEFFCGAVNVSRHMKSPTS